MNCSVNFMKRFLKTLGDLMNIYLKSSEKHVFDMPCFAFKLHNNIIVPSWVLLDVPSSKREVVESYFKLWNKVSSISASSPRSFSWNESSNIPSMTWVSHKK